MLNNLFVYFIDPSIATAALGVCPDDLMNDLECDAVIHLRGGQYGLIEVKLGGDDWVNAGAETLKKLAAKIDTTKMKSPSFLMVLTAIGSYAYRRPDGVYVVPIGCLKD